MFCHSNKIDDDEEIVLLMLEEAMPKAINSIINKAIENKATHLLIRMVDVFDEILGQRLQYNHSNEVQYLVNRIRERYKIIY